MDRERLEKLKADKKAAKDALKGKDKAKLTRKELDDLTIKMAKILGIVE